MFRPSKSLSVKDREGADVKNVDFCLPNAVPTVDSVPNNGRLSMVGRSGSSNPRGGRSEVSSSYAEAKSKAGREEDLFFSLCSDDEDDGLMDFDLPNAVLTPDKRPLSKIGHAGRVNPRPGGKKFSPTYDEAKSPTGVVEDLFITDCSDDEGGLMDFDRPNAVLTLDTVPNIGPLSEVGRAGCSNLQAGENDLSPKYDEAKSPTEKPKTLKKKIGNFFKKMTKAVELPFLWNNKVETIIPSELDADSANPHLKGDAGLASHKSNVNISPDKRKASKRPVFGCLQGGKVESVPTPQLEADPAIPDVKDVVDLAIPQSKTNVDPDKHKKKASKSHLFNNPWRKKVETVVLTQQLDADPAILVVKDGADLASRELKTHIRPKLKAGIAAANAELQTCARNTEPKGARWPWQKDGRCPGPKDGKSPRRKDPRTLRPKHAAKPGLKDAGKSGLKDAGKSGLKDAGKPGPKDAVKPKPKDAINPQPKGGRWPWQIDDRPKKAEKPRPKDAGKPGPKDAEKSRPKDGKSGLKADIDLATSKIKDHTSHAKPVPAPKTSSAIESFHSKYYFSKSDVLGQGSFGKVYKGMRRSDGKEVAIKVIQKSRHDKYLVTPGYTKPLLTEVALMLKMRESPISPFVIQMYDWYEDPRIFGLVLEYSQPCETLWKFMNSRFRQPESIARTIMHQAVQAVQDCLNHGVFHTDIHPENFLLDTENMKLKLIDFGLGHLLTEDGYNSKDFRGAPLFTPPEVHTEPKYYAMSTNVWALGVLLYTMVNGFYPFPEKANKSHKLQLTKNFFSKEICDLIKWCLAKKPTKRPTIQQILDHDWFKIK